MGALRPPHHRSQHLEPGALVHGRDAVHDMLGSLADQPLSGLGIVGHADAGVEQAQAVVHLGDGAHRGAGAARRALLDSAVRRAAACWHPTSPQTLDGPGCSQGRRPEALTPGWYSVTVSGSPLHPVQHGCSGSRVAPTPPPPERKEGDGHVERHCRCSRTSQRAGRD